MPGTLHHSPARVVHALLVADGYGASSGQWTTKTDGEPDLPDDAVTVYNVAGRNDGFTMSGEMQTWHGVQVRVRAANPETGYRKANAIAVFFDAGFGAGRLVNVDGTQYNLGSVHRTGDVASLGRDAPNSNRRLFTLDCLVSVTMLPTM